MHEKKQLKLSKIYLSLPGCRFMAFWGHHWYVAANIKSFLLRSTSQMLLHIKICSTNSSIVPSHCKHFNNTASQQTWLTIQTGKCYLLTTCENPNLNRKKLKLEVIYLSREEWVPVWQILLKSKAQFYSNSCQHMNTFFLHIDFLNDYI